MARCHCSLEFRELEGRMVQKEVREVDRGHIVRSLDGSCQLRLLIWQVTEHPIDTGLKKKGTYCVT